eukprot:32542_5
MIARGIREGKELNRTENSIMSRAGALTSCAAGGQYSSPRLLQVLKICCAFAMRSESTSVFLSVLV